MSPVSPIKDDNLAFLDRKKETNERNLIEGLYYRLTHDWKNRERKQMKSRSIEHVKID